MKYLEFLLVIICFPIVIYCLVKKGKFQFKKRVLSTSARIKRLIIDAQYNGKKENYPSGYWALVGIYDTRLFGLCLYRNDDTFLK